MTSEPSKEHWWQHVSVSNVITGIVLILLPAIGSAYVSVRVMNTQIGLIESRFSTMSDWIKRVDERSQTRRTETLQQVERELDAMKDDVRELRAAQLSGEARK